MAAAKVAGDAGGAAASKDVTGLFLVPRQPYDGRPKTMRITMTSSPVAAIALCVVLASPAFADTYAAVSNTAMSITGDIELDETGITFENGEQLTFDEQVADRLTVDGQPVEAHVFRLAQARDPVLLNGNRLCGAPVTYAASWETSDGDGTVLAVFSTPEPPKSDADMCASYTYE